MAYDEKINIGGGCSLRVASDGERDSDVEVSRGLVYRGLLSPEGGGAAKGRAGMMSSVSGVFRKIKNWRWIMSSQEKVTMTLEIKAALGNGNSLSLMQCKTVTRPQVGEESDRARNKDSWLDLAINVRRALSISLLALGRPQTDDVVFVSAVRARLAQKQAQAERELEAKNKEAKNAEAKNA